MAATAYAIKAAQKMADNDFEKIGFKSAIRFGLSAIQWIIRIGKHIGSISIKSFSAVKFKNNNEEIGIPNESGDILFIPRKYYECYTNVSPFILSKIAALVEDERTMTKGVENDWSFAEEAIEKKEKRVFCPEDEEEDDVLLFPELIHGQTVSLIGDITRGNENSNTLGFRYKDHILNCIPARGSIVKYKRVLFEQWQIIGTIDRNDKFGNPIEKKPRIIFDDISPLPENTTNLNLF